MSKGGNPIALNTKVIRDGTRVAITGAAPGNALVVDPDGNVGVSGGGGVTSVSYTELIALLDTSALVAGTTYYVNDRDLWLVAISTSQLSPFGKRRMKCVYGYEYSVTSVPSPATFTRNIGIWNPVMNGRTNHGGFTEYMWNITPDGGDFAEDEIITGQTSGKIAAIRGVIVDAGVNYLVLQDYAEDFTTFTTGETVATASGKTGVIAPPTILAGEFAAIWGGYFWINQTGEIGTALNYYELDSTNWLRVEKNDELNAGVYTEVIFDVVYDVGHDWITEQRDQLGNVIGITISQSPGYNPCDISQWNDSRVYGNHVPYGIFANHGNAEISNNRSSQIAYNRLNRNGRIGDNNCFNVSSTGCAQGIFGNIGVDIGNNLVAGLWQNEGAGANIYGNVFNGSIHENKGTISENTYTLGSGEIAYNVVPQGIGSNTCGQIYGNNCQVISQNTCLAVNGNRCNYINSNSNTGEITNNCCNDILSNTLDGDISTNVIAGDIVNNGGTGSISRKIYPTDIAGLTLAADITTTPGVPAAITTASLVGKTATFGDDGQLTDFS